MESSSFFFFVAQVVATQRFFMFTPKIGGRWNPFWLIFFQMGGCFNHHLLVEKVWGSPFEPTDVLSNFPFRIGIE